MGAWHREIQIDSDLVGNEKVRKDGATCRGIRTYSTRLRRSDQECSAASGLILKVFASVVEG